MPEVQLCPGCGRPMLPIGAFSWACPCGVEIDSNGKVSYPKDYPKEGQRVGRTD